jgi:hypothetical protein
VAEPQRVGQFVGAAEGERPPFGADLAERVFVPYPIESALSGIMRHEDRMWYRRTFTVPPSWRADQGHRLPPSGAVPLSSSGTAPGGGSCQLTDS